MRTSPNRSFLFLKDKEVSWDEAKHAIFGLRMYYLIASHIVLNKLKNIITLTG